MKKIAMFIAAAAIAVSASAQNKTAIVGSKVTDNIYIGGALGTETPLAGDKSGSSFNPNLTFMVGKNFTPVFGLRAEVMARFNAHSNNCDAGHNCTGVNGTDLNILTTWNMNNLFAHYKGEPRFFEVSVLYGLGWGHQFDHTDGVNVFNSKAGLDFTFNLGKDKQYQIFIEPAFTWGLTGTNTENITCEYNAKYSTLEVKAGFIYKFKCSNGRHNFTYERLRDQGEIDSLNAQINELRAEIDKTNASTAALNAKAADLKNKLTECQNTPKTVVEKAVANLQPSVVFKQGKSIVEKSQLPNVSMIAKYMKNNKDAKIKILGYASPEGSKELNQKLSEKRAEAVKKVLVKKYKISAKRLETQGLGATDKLFDEVEFNRVVLFNDETK